MSKFNTTSVRARNGEGFIGTATVEVRNHNGGTSVLRNAKSELFLAAVSDFAGEDTFYESAGSRTKRVNDLIHEVAVSDIDWIASFVKWLREEANMRSISLVIALEAAKALLNAGIPGARGIVTNALKRADEPGEAIGYWHSQHGRKIPSAVKRGIADATVNLYNEYSLGKYDTASKGFRFADVIQLTHPSPSTPLQSDLFKFAMDRRRDASAKAPESLKMAEKRKAILALPKDEMRALIKSENGSAELKAAGLTWEAVAGSVGLDKEIWEALIPTLGYMALLRNLRNFEQAGVSGKVLDKVAERLADEEAVAKSRQLPFRFLSAHRAVSGYETDMWGRMVKNAGSLRFVYPLEKALNASLSNVPALKGNTLILVDRSGSMFGSPSKNTQLSFADSAAVFGAALAVRAEKATLVEFGTYSREIPFLKQSSVLNLVESFTSMGGTNTAAAIKAHYKPGVHTRVVIITDEQYSSYYGDPSKMLPESVPLFTWNLVGYAPGGAARHNRYFFGGLSDQSFKLIPFIEAGNSAKWPWMD